MPWMLISAFLSQRGMCAWLSCGGAYRRHEFRHGLPGASDRGFCRLGTDFLRFNVNEGDIRQTVEAQDRAQIRLLEIVRFGRAFAGVDAAARGDDIHLLVLQEALGT